MESTCNIAFKEWAAVCEALAAGRQTIILRKGGLQDEIEKFRRAAHQGFWLYPTNFHQQAESLSGDAGALIKRAAEARPADRQVAIRLYAKLNFINDLTTEVSCLRLAGLHIWSEATVRQRFAYRFPRLFVLGVRIFVRRQPLVISESPEMAGCRSRLTLPEPISTEGLTPVLTDEQYLQQGKAVSAALA